ncbi:MAG: hypothetical protein RL385_37 [Pseudomonadota bacterium]
MSAKKKPDFGALAATQISRNVTAAAAAPDRFERAKAVMAGPPTYLELDAIVARQQSTRELDEGHVSALMESIAELGLIEPIVLDVKHRLLAGGHRLEALRRLRVERPERYQQLFAASGVPVYTKDFDADASPDRALAVEVAENEHRRDYTAPQIRELVQRLKDAGYRDTVGRPKAGEKALGPALAVIVGKSLKTIRKVIAEGEAQAADGEGGGQGGRRAPSPLEQLRRVLLKHKEVVPASVREVYEALMQGIDAELGGAG